MQVSKRNFARIFVRFGGFPLSYCDVAAHAEVSTQTVRKYLKDLEERGLVAVVSKRPLKFTLSDAAVKDLELPITA